MIQKSLTINESHFLKWFYPQVSKEKNIIYFFIITIIA